MEPNIYTLNNGQCQWFNKLRSHSLARCNRGCRCHTTILYIAGYHCVCSFQSIFVYRMELEKTGKPLCVGWHYCIHIFQFLIAPRW